MASGKLQDFNALHGLNESSKSALRGAAGEVLRLAIKARPRTSAPNSRLSLCRIFFAPAARQSVRSAIGLALAGAGDDPRRQGAHLPPPPSACVGLVAQQLSMPICVAMAFAQRAMGHMRPPNGLTPAGVSEWRPRACKLRGAARGCNIIHISLCVYVYVKMCVLCLRVRVRARAGIYVHIHTHTHTHICLYICGCVCIHI